LPDTCRGVAGKPAVAPKLKGLFPSALISDLFAFSGGAFKPKSAQPPEPMKTRTETKCSHCRRALSDDEIRWTQTNTRSSRPLFHSFCERFHFKKRTRWNERIWAGLFKTPYGEFLIGYPSTDP
jgi:hypothetical protein